MKYLFCNWKMYLDYQQSIALTKQVKKLKFDKKKLSVAVFPTYIAVPETVKELKKTAVKTGVQDVFFTPQGAYTGAVSAYIAKRAGATHAIVGHSERRYVFGEHDEDVRKKIEACLEAGLTPVVCVGETKEDLDNDKRQYRLKKQLMHAFDGLNIQGGKIIVAYEPVWAIGTDNACDPATADDVIGFIKKEISRYVSVSVPVLYGGSVGSKNMLSYTNRDMIDGVLVGSASTKITEIKAMLSGLSHG